ncbi:hypothetical protein Tco_1320631 [Tanacetum coccineum]
MIYNSRGEKHALFYDWMQGTLLKQLAIANKSIGGGFVVVIPERNKEGMEMDIVKLEFNFMGTSYMQKCQSFNTCRPKKFLKVCEQRKFEPQQKAAGHAAKLHMDDMGSMSMKEVIELHARHNNILFTPKPGRMQDSHQVHGFRNISLIKYLLN